jgi:16S rRNA processing protein RimM
MPKPENPVLMAQIGAPHGVKGEVRVKSFTSDPMALADYGPLYSADGRKFKIVRLRPANTVLVVKFKGLNWRDEVEKLNRMELYVDRSLLPDDNEEDEFYITDLAGMDVLNEAEEKIGTVIDIPNFGAGDMLEIKPAAVDGKLAQSYYLPFTRAVVPTIDFDKRTLLVVPPNEISGRPEDDGKGEN